MAELESEMNGELHSSKEVPPEPGDSGEPMDTELGPDKPEESGGGGKEEEDASMEEEQSALVENGSVGGDEASRHSDGSEPSKHSDEDAGRRSDEEDGKYSDDEDPVRHSDEDAGRHSDEDAGRHSDEDAGKHSDADAGRHSDEDAGRHSDEDAGRHSDESAGRHSDEDAGRDSYEDDGDQTAGDEGSKHSKRVADQDKENVEEKDASSESDQKAGDDGDSVDKSVKSVDNSLTDTETGDVKAKGDDGATKEPSSNGVTEQSAAPTTAAEPEETTISSDSDIEEIEQPVSRSNGAAASGGGARAPVVIDTEALLAGRSSAAAAAAASAAAAGSATPHRPPPLTRAPPHQHPEPAHQYRPQPQPPPQAGYPGVTQHLMINPSVLSALAQYGINTAGMTPDQLLQLQEYYRRSHEDTEFILEAPSFIVPYVMESPPELNAKQFMAKVTEEASKAVNGEKDGGVKKAEDGEKKAEDDAEKKDADAAKDGESNKENKPDRREEDFSHLGKWAYYYQAPVGQLLLDQGRCIVEEFIKDDLLKQQKRKAAKEKGGGSEATRFAIKSLTANLAASRKRNAPFHLRLTQCRYCAFETESVLVMERHLEMPHMVGAIYQCNFCDFETRSPQVVLAHMAAEHNVTGRLERAPASFQCPLCNYEDSGKTRMTRHLNSCQKKFRIDKNQALDDWVPPAKVPKIHRGRPNVLGKQFEPVRGAVGAVGSNKSMQQAIAAAQAARGRGRPVGSYKDGSPAAAGVPPRQSYSRQAAPPYVPGMARPPQPPGGQMIMPPHYQIGNQIYQLVNNQLVPVSQSQARANSSGVQIIPTPTSSGPSPLNVQASQPQKSASPAAAAGGLKFSSTPSISITPVPRPNLPPSVPSILRAAAAGSQLSITKGTVGARPDPSALGKGAFVICEICDGYIKDLEQLRNHMQWIHKVKIHPKMIYNRPPLNCQKCQLRFFTDQGLERHLLGSHGLVTSSMQDAANKGHDSGRCPICGKVYQWKLLHHVSKDHMVTLKPAHLSYKCTVCTATFSMYKQFENHVYSSHSVVAKKIMESSDRKKAAAAAAVSGQPIKLNDEITIIPHPAKPAAPVAQPAQKRQQRVAPAPPPEVECQVCDHRAAPRTLHDHYRRHHLGRCEVEFTPFTQDPACAEFVTDELRQQLKDHAEEAARAEIEVEVSDEEDEGSTPSGGSALSKLNKDITITPIGGGASLAERPRRVLTVKRPRRFMGPLSVKRRRVVKPAPRSVKQRRQRKPERKRNPSVVELSDGEDTPPAQEKEKTATVDLAAEEEDAGKREKGGEDEKEVDKSDSEVMEVEEVGDEKGADNAAAEGQDEEKEGSDEADDNSGDDEDLESRGEDEGDEKEDAEEPDEHDENVDDDDDNDEEEPMDADE